MGARHSKRSVDISAAAKKDKESTSEEKLERIDEPEAAKQNGTTTPRPEEPKEGSGDATTPQVNGDDKGEEEETKEGETAEKKEDETEKKEPQTPESPVEAEAKSPEEPKSEKKKKDKKEKRKWSFRSLSFNWKDKSKPNMSKDDSITNDLAKVADTVAEVVEGEAAAATEENKETAEAPAAVEEKKEEKEAPAAPLASVISSISSAASNVVEEVKEKVEEKKEEVKSEVVTKAEEIIEEGKAIVQKTVEQVIEKTSSLVESSSSSFSTTVVESSQVITSSSQLIKETLEIKPDDSLAPPLPASPPPTEAPPPTPNVISQPEPEEVNGGGEGMAEMPEENGLGSDKIDDDEEEVVPKMNGHSDVSPVKQVENIIDAIKSEAIEKTILAENNGELMTTQEALKAAEE